MIQHEYALLTDDLERHLMLAAIDEQFRPQPLRALGRLSIRLASAVALAAKRVVAKRLPAIFGLFSFTVTKYVAC
jgi:hypothetical protein